LRLGVAAKLIGGVALQGTRIDNRPAGPRRRRCDRTTNREVQEGERSRPSGAARLDYTGLRIRFRGGRINIGPVGTTLTQGAADALNAAFGVSALSDDMVVGDAIIRYRLFAF
jgi:hypothetical protein